MPNNTLIVIPAFNAAKTIDSVMTDLRTNAKLLVVDDGSTDDTEKIVASLGYPVLSHETNCGVGKAIKTGIRYAIDNDYSHIICLDSDGQHSPSYINPIIELLEAYDFVIGNRFHHPTWMPYPKLASNCLGCILVNSVFDTRVHDISSGYRGFKVKPELLSIENNRYGYVFAHLFHAICSNQRIGFIDIPIIYDHSQLLCTRQSELDGFLKALLTFIVGKSTPFFNVIVNLASNVANSVDFEVCLGTHSFYGFYMSKYNSYVIQTNPAEAIAYYNSLGGI